MSFKVTVIERLWDDFNRCGSQKLCITFNRCSRCPWFWNWEISQGHSYRTTFCQWDRGVSRSLDLEVVTPDIWWAKLCYVDGPIYFQVTCYKMSPSFFILRLLWYSFENWRHYVILWLLFLCNIVLCYNLNLLEIDLKDIFTNYVSCVELFVLPIWRQLVHILSIYITYSKFCVSCGHECISKVCSN